MNSLWLAAKRIISGGTDNAYRVARCTDEGYQQITLVDSNGNPVNLGGSGGDASAEKQDEQTLILSAIETNTSLISGDKETPFTLYRVKTGQSFTGANAGDPILAILVIDTVANQISTPPIWFNGKTKLQLNNADVDTAKLEIIAANSLTASELATLTLTIQSAQLPATLGKKSAAESISVTLDNDSAIQATLDAIKNNTSSNTSDVQTLVTYYTAIRDFANGGNNLTNNIITKTVNYSTATGAEISTVWKNETLGFLLATQPDLANDVALSYAKGGGSANAVYFSKTFTAAGQYLYLRNDSLDAFASLIVQSPTTGTGTFSVQASNDNGVTWFSLPTMQYNTSSTFIRESGLVSLGHICVITGHKSLRIAASGASVSKTVHCVMTTANYGTYIFGGQIDNVSGNKLHNNSAPTGSNIGVLASFASRFKQRFFDAYQTLLNTDLSGQLRVTLPEQTLMNELRTAQRQNEVSLSFSLDYVPATGYSFTAVNGATIAQTLGLGVLDTGTTSGASSIEIVSDESLEYIEGAECYCEFSARFDTMTAVNTARIGIQGVGNSVNDGVYLSNDGNNFQIIKNTNGTESAIASGSFNDALNGGATSLFRQAGTPVSYNKNNVNLFRIKWAWFGAAPIIFEIMSPDGEWVEFYRYLHPNNSAALWATTSRFRFRAYLAKSSGATSVKMGVGCVAMGTTALKKKGALPHHRTSTTGLNPTVIKANTGRLLGLSVLNLSANHHYIKFYDKSSAPSVGTDTPVLTIFAWNYNSPDMQVFAKLPPEGILFKRGIAYAITGGLADTDTTTINENEVIVNAQYV